uniref:Gag protein n=1 Tax=Acrobeloides nanus TaxID=290746 RepID=A0A914D8G6_9BILA
MENIQANATETSNDKEMGELDGSRLKPIELDKEEEILDYDENYGPIEELGKSIKLMNLAQQMQVALQNLPILSGHESHSEITRYFKKFEALTMGWDSEKRSTLLSLKVSGHAQLIYDSQPDLIQNNYNKMKQILLSKLTHTNATQSSASHELMTGIPRKHYESILDFSQRVERLVRAAVDPGCPESYVLDQCKQYFLHYLNELSIIQTLTIQKSFTDFHTLVKHAISLKDSVDSLNQRRYRPVENFSISRTPPPFRTNYFGNRAANVPQNVRSMNSLITTNDFGDPIGTFQNRSPRFNANYLRNTNFQSNSRPPFAFHSNPRSRLAQNGHNQGNRRNPTGPAKSHAAMIGEVDPQNIGISAENSNFEPV